MPLQGSIKEINDPWKNEKKKDKEKILKIFSNTGGIDKGKSVCKKFEKIKKKKKNILVKLKKIGQNLKKNIIEKRTIRPRWRNNKQRMKYCHECHEYIYVYVYMHTQILTQANWRISRYMNKETSAW